MPYGYKGFQAQFAESLKALKLDYIDAYLIHRLVLRYGELEYQERNADAWKAMKELYDQGKVRTISVSNFLKCHIIQIEEKRGGSYVADTVEMLWNNMPSGKETVYNVGDLPASEMSIYEMAKMIGAYLNVPGNRPQTDARGLAKAPTDVQLDMIRYMREFSMTVFVGLEEGLARIIDWYRQSFPKK